MERQWRGLARMVSLFIGLDKARYRGQSRQRPKSRLLKQKWNHDALFDYQDYYIQETRRLKKPGWHVSWSGFPLAMWDQYRSSY